MSLIHSRWLLILTVLFLDDGRGYKTTTACTLINFTNTYLRAAGDIHPFDHDVSELGGVLDTQTCESIDEAFDGDISTKWLEYDFGANGTWIELRLETVPCLSKYSITSGNDFEGRDPSSWTLSGSLDGSTWTILDVRQDIEFSKRQETQDFHLTYSHYFNWFRFDFADVRDTNSGGNIIQISEISFYTGDCTDHSGIWFEFSNREITSNFHQIESDHDSFLSLQECKDLCIAHNASDEYYRDYQCSAISYLPQWRQYGVDHSSECDLIQYWGEPQLGISSDGRSFYTRDLGDCHDGVLIDESCYRLSEDSEGLVDWETAEASCEAWGGYLTVIDDDDEATLLAFTIRPIRDEPRWIGLSTHGDCSGTYHWSNNAQVDLSASYLQFVSNTSTSSDVEANSHCVSVYDNSNRNAGKKLQDRSCEETLGFICEKDIPEKVEDLDDFTCPGHTVCNGVGQVIIEEGNWANDTVCGCEDGFVATGNGVECECSSGTFLKQADGTSSDANKFCETARTCNKWGQYVVEEASPTSDTVCGCLSNASSCDPNA